jgi:alanine racemase/UDP-N-acetylmuramoyl-tripeptide--D-alanyl-D-alanine ligase
METKMDLFDLRLWEGFTTSGGNNDKPAFIDQVVIDSRRIDSPKSLFIALQGDVQNGEVFVGKAFDAGALYAIVQEDFSYDLSLPEHFKLLKVKDPLKALQEIAKAYRKTKKAQVIAICGSYGKTMVKDLLHSLFARVKCTVSSPESFNSQIGVPLSLLTIQDKHEVAIIEAAVSKKNEMDALNDMVMPDAAIFTQIGKKHFITLGSIEAQAKEVAKIICHDSVKDWVLIPNTTAFLDAFKNIKTPCYFWNTQNAELPFAISVPSKTQGKLTFKVFFPDGDSYTGQTTSGFYYFLDLINICLKAAWLRNIPTISIIETLKTFNPEPMRTELWQSNGGAVFINDTYCSDPQSVDQSLKYLAHCNSGTKKTFLFSGMRGSSEHRESEFKRIGIAITKAKLEELVLIGNHPFNSLIKEVQEGSPETSISFQPSMQDAIKALQVKIGPQDFVLIKGEKKQSLDYLTEAFDGSVNNNQCTINFAAIQANLQTIRNKLPPNTRIMVMVKALAYGTSDIRMAKFLKTVNIDILGVSYVDEGVSLRQLGCTQEIFVLNATPSEIPKVLEYGLTIGVSNSEFIEELSNQAFEKKIQVKVHLHVNTGMNRFGCLPEEAYKLSEAILNSPHLIFDGIMTHFAAADDKNEDAFTHIQAEILTTIINEIEKTGFNIPWKHACNSSGALRFNFPQFNMVRIGLAIYGLYASAEIEPFLELRLAISLVCRIVGLNHCRTGDTISYGRSYKVEEKQKKIAVLPIGYFDGLHRNYSGKGYVIISGIKAPMVGKICMDYVMVDVSDVPNVQIGDKVLVFGEDDYGNYISPEEFAMNGDSIVYELITCLGPRIQRVFIFEEAFNLR